MPLYIAEASCVIGYDAGNGVKKQRVYGIVAAFYRCGHGQFRICVYIKTRMCGAAFFLETRKAVGIAVAAMSYIP